MAEAPSRPPVEDWRTDLDHLDPRFVADPYPIYEELREQCPIAHSERYGGMTWLTKAQDISAAAHDTEAFSSRRVALNEVSTDKKGLVLPPLNFDPPDHTESRRTMLPYFSPKAVAAWEPTIREICAGLLDALDGRTEVDAACDYSQELPGDITTRMLGVPLEDAPMFRGWLHDLLEVGPVDEDVARETTSTMMGYILELIDQRRGDSRPDDLLSHLMNQELDGHPINDSDMSKMLLLILIAGIDTTWSAIGSSLLHLATHPEDRQRLVDDPTLIPAAVEEFLRAYAPVFVARITNEEAEVGGCPVPAGEWTVLAFPSANRDPEAFDRPDDVIIDRQENRHAAFGLGVHRCLGSNLARLEMQVAIEMWLERFPDFELIDPDAVTYSAGLIRGPRRIPVRILQQA